VIDIGITMGDPGGVGPEVLLSALGDREIRSKIRPKVFADRAWLDLLAGRFGWEADFEIEQAAEVPAGLSAGEFTEEGGRAALACLQAAADALEKGEIAALVTAPVHKRAFGLGDGPGHTEWLARRFKAKRAVMMLCGPRLRVILATTHVPLRDLPRAITRQGLVDTVMVAERELRRYFLKKGPRLALAALNPHGEEDGRPGREEQEILIPAVSDLRKRGVNIEIIDLLTISPMDGDTIAESVRKTGRCVIVQEAPKSLGAASEIIARLNERSFLYLEAPIKRVAHYDVVTPYFGRELLYLPTPERVERAIVETLDF